MMDDDEAAGIARECLYVLLMCRLTFPGAYEYFMGELDIEDDTLDEAYDTLEKARLVGETCKQVTVPLLDMGGV